MAFNAEYTDESGNVTDYSERIVATGDLHSIPYSNAQWLEVYDTHISITIEVLKSVNIDGETVYEVTDVF